MTTTFLQSKFQRVRTATRQFSRNEKGNAAAMFGIAAIPMMAAAGIAIDFDRVLDAKTALQSLADRSALAGAANPGNEAAKETAAETFASENPVVLGGLTYTTPTATADDVSVSVDFSATVETTLFGVIDVSSSGGGNSGGSSTDSLDFPINSRARYQDGSVSNVCILSLNPSVANAIHVQGTGDVVADECGVHADSTNAAAIYGNGNAFLGADFIHAVGGADYVGNDPYQVEPEEGQAVFGDPFADEDFWADVNDSSGCGNTTSTNGTGNGNSAAAATQLTGTKYNNISVNSNKYGHLTQAVVYVFGTMDIKGTLTTNTSGATIVLCGPDAKIQMGSQGSMKIQAPTGTDFAGFAVIGNATATAQSTLRGGSNTKFVGIWYTPEGSISAGGTSDFNTDSDYFPIIADKVYTFGTANVNIENDWAAYDYEEREELQLVKDRNVWLADY